MYHKGREKENGKRKEGRKGGEGGREGQHTLFGNNRDLISTFAIEDPHPHLGARVYPGEPYTSAGTRVVLPATVP